MMRIALAYLLPLLAPTVIYFLWMVPSWRRAKAEGREPEWHKIPWIVLAGLGALCLAAVLGFTAFNDGAPPWSPYEPARLDGGKVTPGQFKP